MLAGMISTEYVGWYCFYRTHYFQDTQLDMRFSELTYAVLDLFFCDPDMHPFDSSLLVPRHEEEQVERPDEDKILMQKTAGPVGDIRFGGNRGCDILSSTDVTDVMVDGATLVVTSAGIPGGMRYVPAGW